MKFMFQTKHLGFALRYREIDEDDGPQFVDNTGGDFDPAPEADDGTDDKSQMHFGFARG